MKPRKLLKVLLIAAAVVIAGVIYTLISRGNSEETAQAEEMAATTVTETETTAEPVTEKIEQVCVYVCGCVKSPGVYYLDVNSRIHEAVEMAGGFTDEAASGYVNLASFVTDGEQIYIPSEEEAADGLLPATYSAAADEGLVNINSATLDELMTLPGIGEVKASSIIEYRTNYGRFESPEDILNVAGIKQSAYEKIKDYITV